MSKPTACDEERRRDRFAMSERGVHVEARSVQRKQSMVRRTLMEAMLSDRLQKMRLSKAGGRSIAFVSIEKVGRSTVGGGGIPRWPPVTLLHERHVIQAWSSIRVGKGKKGANSELLKLEEKCGQSRRSCAAQEDWDICSHLKGRAAICSTESGLLVACCLIRALKIAGIVEYDDGDAPDG